MLVQTPAPSSKRARAKVQGTVLWRRSSMTRAQLYGSGPVLMRRRLSSRPSSTGRQIARTVPRRVQKAFGVEQICRVLSNSAEKPGWFNLQRLHSATGVVPPAERKGNYYAQPAPTGGRTQPVEPPLIPERFSACRWEGLPRGGFSLSRSLSEWLPTSPVTNSRPTEPFC